MRYEPTPEEIQVAEQLAAKGYREASGNERGGLYIRVRVNGEWTQVRGISLDEAPSGRRPMLAF